MAKKREETALGVARARFVDGLPRKAGELRGAIALLTASPDADKPREEMRRRLHALYASAQVFRIESLAEALKDGIACLDRARDERRGLGDDDLDALAHLSTTLPVLAGAVLKDTPSVAPAASTYVPPPPSAAPPSAGPPKTKLTSLPPAMIEALPDVELPAAAPVPGPRTTGPILETIVSVLVVDGAEVNARVRATLPAESFEVLAAGDADEALRLARSTSPDIVLVDSALALDPGTEFIDRLRADPLTDFVPIVLLCPSTAPMDAVAVREAGADESLSKPVDLESLPRTIARLTGLGGGLRGFEALGDVTIAEVADRLADEIRRGIVESVDRGGELSIPMGEGSDVLAAAWSAIARVRTSLSERSGGRVHFRDASGLGGPELVSFGDDEDGGEARTSIEVSLAGRRIIVADDDPAVTWFFSGLLREEGAHVVEAEDGLEALEAARQKRPDVILSDILMPRMDGLALCREVARDPALGEVPIILLSWKEDFLQRMRELRSGASGYLRKEAGSAQILARVRKVLEPQARLEARLRAGGEVRGRIEGLGVLPLLRIVGAERPDARITLRDAWNLHEVDVRGGDLLDITCTATDGSFARGARALPRLLGVAAGRFSITGTDTTVRASLVGDMDATLRDAVEQLGALVDAVSGRGLSKAAKIILDPDVLESFLRSSPDEVQSIVAELQAGRGPRAMLLAGDVAPQDLEAALVDLARRGVITAVLGEDDEDRVEVALARRQHRAPEEDAAQDPSATIPAPPSSEATGADAGEPDGGEPDGGEPDAGGPDAGGPGAGGLDWIESEESTADIVQQMHELASKPLPGKAAPVAVVDDPLGLEPKVARPLEAEPPPSTDLGLDYDVDLDADLPEEAEHRSDAIPPPGREEDSSVLGWMLLLVGLFIAGFFGWRAIGPRFADDAPPEIPQTQPETLNEPAPEEPAVPEAQLLDASADSATPRQVALGAAQAMPLSSEAVLARSLQVGSVTEGVEAGGENVPEDHGVLVVQTSAQGTPTQVRLLGSDRGAPPLNLALPEGRHEVEFRQGSRARYRFVTIRRGQTRILAAP